MALLEPAAAAAATPVPAVPVPTAPTDQGAHDVSEKAPESMQKTTDSTMADFSSHRSDKDIHQGRPACFSTLVQELSFVFITTFAMAMGPFLSGVTSVIPYFVQVDLGMTQAEVTWLTSSSALSSGAFLLFFGRLADLFGRKPLLVGSFIMFSIFTLAAGFARTPISLDVLNGVLGLATAAAIPPAQGSLSVVYGKPSKRKNAAFACFSAGNPVGFALGMLFGGIATQLFGWRASYWLLSIIYALATVAAVWCMPRDTTPKRKLDSQILREFDLVGVALAVSGVAMFTAALTLGAGAPQGFRTPYVLILLILGFLIMVGFIIWDIYYPHPLLPMHIWRDKNFSLVVAILGLGMAAFAPSLFFVALFFQRVWLFSAISTAVHLLPLVIMGVIVNIFAGAVLHRINNKLLMLIGALSYTTCFILLGLNTPSMSYWAFIFPGMIFCVMGADIEFNVANMYVMTSLPAEQQSIASGIFQTALKLFQTISFGLTTAIFDGVEIGPAWTGRYAGGPEVRAYAAVYWFAVGLSAISVLLVMFLTIGTQGGKQEVERKSDVMGEAEKA